jgi:hypothetical protein
MASKKWVPIIVGIVIFVVLVGAGLLGGLAYLLSQQMTIKEVPAAEGAAEFERVAASLAGQMPFIELPEGDFNGRIQVHRELETKETGSVSRIHMRAWSERDRKLVRADLPFWLLRLGGSHPVRFNSGPGSDIALRITPEEIDRRGPGLILRHSNSRGEHVLIWTD